MAAPQSTFTALNVDYDFDEANDEVDDTRELQIEDALKLYQNAIRLHAQGPAYCDEAKAAYDTLFKSEIFRYEDPQLDSLLDPQADDDDGSESSDDVDVVVPALSGLRPLTDASPSTLPQILHLAYKNRGQLELDYVRHRSKARSDEDEEEWRSTVRERLHSVLDYYVHALRADDTDSELWRRTGRIAGALGKTRIERLCLETPLFRCQNNASGERATSGLGLEDSFALEQLKKLLGQIHDEVSLNQDPIYRLRRQRLLPSLRPKSDAYPFLPSGVAVGPPHSSGAQLEDTSPQRHKIIVSELSWTAVGQALLEKISGSQDDEQGVVEIVESPTASRQVELRQGRVTSASRFNNTVNADEKRRSPWISDIPIAASCQDQHMSDGTPSERIGFSFGMKEGDAEDSADAKSRAQCQGNQEATGGPPVKRTSGAAGLQDTGDGGRGRSKRLRARETMNETVSAEDKSRSDSAKKIDLQLREHAAADNDFFQALQKLLTFLGVDSPGGIASLRASVGEHALASPTTTVNSSATDLVAKDLYTALQSWNSYLNSIFLRNAGTDGHKKSKEKMPLTQETFASLQTFQRYATFRNWEDGDRLDRQTSHPDLRFGLMPFLKQVNENSLRVTQVALLWTYSLLSSQTDSSGSEDASSFTPVWCRSSYHLDRWPGSMKKVVTRMIVELDEPLLRACRCTINDLMDQLESGSASESVSEMSLRLLQIANLAQTIFELHLDEYGALVRAGDGVKDDSCDVQKERAERWAMMVDELAEIYNMAAQDVHDGGVGLRYLWASAMLLTLSENTSRAYKVRLMYQLKNILESTGNPVIELPNSILASEISAAAAERSIYSLASSDFFEEIFDYPPPDPDFIIERLELVLNPPAEYLVDIEGTIVLSGGSGDDDHIIWDPECDLSALFEAHEILRMRARAAVEFVSRGPPQLRAFLWACLGNWYQEIGNNAKALSCMLQGLETVVTELHKPSRPDNLQQRRCLESLYWLRFLDEQFIPHIYSFSLSTPDAFRDLDDSLLISSLTALAQLARILHAEALHGDSVKAARARVYRSLIGSGRVKSAETNLEIASNYLLEARSKFRLMQHQVWLLLFMAVRERLLRKGGPSLPLSGELAAYLRALLQVGREPCLRGKAFKTWAEAITLELIRLNDIEDSEDVVLQLLSDIYGFNLGSGASSRPENDSGYESLDRPQALRLIGFLIPIFQRVAQRDLCKPEYKTIIERLQVVLGRPKRTRWTTINSRLIEDQLKSSINPRQLYRCVRGLVSLPGIDAPAEEADVTRTGWYRFVGDLALYRFRSQRRAPPLPTEDLDVAIEYLKLDLQHNLDNWESWFLLGQAYDRALDNDLWTGEKLQSAREELLTHERRAIHCYAMAVSCAARSANSSSGAADKLSTLYADFGTRIYSSSRAPFSMEVFHLDAFRKPFSSGAIVYDDKPHPELSEYRAWKFASVLFAKALVGKPDSWLNHYMRSKCLWKMLRYQEGDSELTDEQLVDPSDVIHCCVRAIECVPERKSGQEPIFEPHYKLVSIVFKLVPKYLEVPDACDILQATPYARKVPPVRELEDWDGYILRILAILRAADKSHWHHRMTARAAHVIYDGAEDDLVAALAARHELSNHFFTKNMHLSIWRPEYQRHGRHYVYKSRYTLFFIKLLAQINDKASLEVLVKRIRKRPSEYFDFPKVWADVSQEYFKLLHRAGHVPEGHEDEVLRNLVEHGEPSPTALAIPPTMTTTTITAATAAAGAGMTTATTTHAAAAANTPRNNAPPAMTTTATAITTTVTTMPASATTAATAAASPSPTATTPCSSSASVIVVSAATVSATGGPAATTATTATYTTAPAASSAMASGTTAATTAATAAAYDETAADADAASSTPTSVAASTPATTP